MESKWRMNVALYGMSHSDWELCARYLSSPEGIDYLLVKETGENGYSTYTAVPGQLPVYLGGIDSTGGFPRPWQDSVESDREPVEF